MDNITLSTISNDPRILHVIFRGAWTWKDLDSVIECKSPRQELPERPFYVVADLTATDKLPPSILFWAYNFFSKAPCTLRQTFVVTDNRFIEGMVTTFRRVFDKYQRAIAVVQSNEEALHLINTCAGCDKVQ